MSKRKPLVLLVNEFLSTCPELLTPGSTLTYKEFGSRFDWMSPGLYRRDPVNTRDAAQFVATYTKLNRVLAQRGIYIKSQNYCTSFVVIEQPRKKVINYRRKAIGCIKAADTLQTGINRYKSRWSSLSTAELENVAPLDIPFSRTTYR